MPETSPERRVVACVCCADLTPAKARNAKRLGCRQRRCVMCDAWLWVSPKALAIAEIEDRQLVCIPCAVRLEAESAEGG